MKHELKKVMKIVDEVMTCCMYRYEASRAEVAVQKSPKAYTLRFQFVGVALSPQELDELKERLSDERNPELEDYYWQLAGEVENSNELALVALMSDEAEVSYEDGTLRLVIIRKL